MGNQTINKSNTSYVFILGAADPEMNLIEEILQDALSSNTIMGTVAYAAVDGNRVHPGNAYRTTDLVYVDHGGTGSGDSIEHSVVVAIECGGDVITPDVVIDHHHPGDPGHGVPADEFIQGSSLGQLISYLVTLGAHKLVGGTVGDDSIELGSNTPEVGDFLMNNHGEWVVVAEDGNYYGIPDEVVLAAAADHCLAAAYRGGCPGVSPHSLLEWRAQTRATFQKVSSTDIMDGIIHAIEVIHGAPKVELSPGVQVADTRGLDTGREGGEASAYMGMAILYKQDADHPANRSGRTKVGLIGGSPTEVTAFMEVWAPDNGVMDVYGSPARGYAGGYKD